MALIDRDRLLSERMKSKYYHLPNGDIAVPLIDIENAPVVDAVPVRHGRWKEDPSGYGFWICSVCGFVSEASAADMLYKFCPVCGAKMDGKDGDSNDS